MRFFVDNSASPRIASALRAAGHDAVHAQDLAMGAATDPQVLAFAAAEGRTIIAEDLDFSALLAAEGAPRVPVISLRLHVRGAARQASLVLAALADVQQHLAAGAIVVIEDTRVRVRHFGPQAE